MSDAEVDLGYKETDDPSLTVRFFLENNDLFGSNTSVLVWTTTPWTLPANAALAVAPNQDYVLLKAKAAPKKDRQNADVKKADSTNDEQLICAAARVTEVFGKDAANNYQVLRKFKGKHLLKLSYERLFDFVQSAESDAQERKKTPEYKKAPNVNKHGWYIIGADFVNMESGTGIVHIAPAYGADDLSVGLQHDLPILHAVAADGRFLTPDTPYSGLFFKDADKPIIDNLKQRGLVWKSERYKHKYPFGYRTGAPLLYYAKNVWYIRTTALKEQLLKNNSSIRWVPQHIQEGRFGKWLQGNRDWALSRERYWGTPLPIWSDGGGNFRVVASRQELSELCGCDLRHLDLHRPTVDEIEFQDPVSGNTMRRVPEVIDCWFDSGAMPYAQWAGATDATQTQPRYFERYFPADFISEAIDQTRGWFYTMLCISSMVSQKSSYKNVICLGHVLDEKGEKMSKSKGNIIDPWQVFQIHGADAIRWYFLTGAPAGNSRRVGQPGTSNDPVAIAHGFLNMLRNSVSFFMLYANLDKISITPDWQNNPIQGALPFPQRPVMDRWLLSKLQELIGSVEQSLTDYDCLQAGKALESFLDSLSNWYIRRNRRRFWKGELDADKLSAYDSLYRCLTVLMRLAAPFTPFVAEESFQYLVTQPLAKLSQTANTMQNLSVTLAPWPQADKQNFYEQKTLQEGELLKDVVFLGRAARMQSGVKVRQPLSRMLLYLEREQDKEIILRNQAILRDELNVKKIDFLDSSADILDYRIKVNLPRIGKRLGAQVRPVQNYLQTNAASKLLHELKTKGHITIPIADNVNGKRAKNGANGKKETPNAGKRSQTELRLLQLGSDDLLIESSVSRADMAGVESNGIFAALETKLTPELVAEGIARDLVRNIQELRKSSGLAVSDRIHLRINQASLRLVKALHDFSDYIASETLAESLKITSEAAPELAVSSSITIAPATAIPIFKRLVRLDKEQVEVVLSKKK